VLFADSREIALRQVSSRRFARESITRSPALDVRRSLRLHVRENLSKPFCDQSMVFTMLFFHAINSFLADPVQVFCRIMIMRSAKILNFNALSNIMITKHEQADIAVYVFIFSVGELFLYGIDRKDH
jgi:hypothetical protein